MKHFYVIITNVIAALLLLSACTSDNEDNTGKVTARFNIGLDLRTRAAQTLNLSTYNATMYLYEEITNNGVTGYQQVQEIQLTDNTLNVENLTPGKNYKAVFLAIPKGQTPELPQLKGQDTTPDYATATADYINGNESDITNDIFRSILTFTASTKLGEQTTILTRQNGALEVRLLNMKDLKEVKLHLNGYKTMFLNDGTGGQVTTSGDAVALSTTKSEGMTSSDIRVRINLLPQENMTDAGGTNNYLEITKTDGTTTKYPIKSDQQTIPIYPNQVTWLTLGNGSGNFDVNFSGNINVEDNEWDGWNDNF